ncbi:uncharacterized protein LOC106151541 [Lingula anatina]|uniref:Uncharacterized protein LOC106151541 n=1 Tax=Lingula anatina TaxID=7574 RepID=A0A1S3H5A8_LINAN|nr:uncharacterized protein LOC106151541 [Lingula anatina]|eukprot:XP_013380319.1 uncharacterized protein LOC106151541 [Lingula anatina]
MWYTDGVPLFKSSKVGLWPLFLSINELPYHDRLKPENLLFAGLWYGKSKPSMSVYLEPFYESLKKLREEGISVNCEHCAKSFVVKGILLCGTCDLPAKCLMMNMAQFNGRFGCPKCKQEGVVVKTGKGHTRTFPFQENSIDGPKRSHEEFIEHGENAFTSSSSVFGVKGPSWWVNISADIINGTAIDYMHTVLLGIVRRLLKLWFDPKFSSEPYSASRFVDIADKRLACIRPPYFIKRHPRSIKDHSQYWKASECRSWLFYYSVPVLFGVLQKEYFEHYLLFVDAMFIMNLDSISPEDLLHCEELLIKFSCLFSSLYGVSHMSANLHQMLHLHDVVRQLGPLWVYSCFSFESMNGKLLKLFHGTQSPAIQIANAVSTLIKLPILEQNIDTDTHSQSAVSQLYCKLSSASDRHKITETICDGVHVIGAKHLQTIEPKYYAVVAQTLKTAPTKCLVFYRLMIKGVLFHCRAHKIASRNSYTVLFKLGGHLQTFGQVVFYTKCCFTCACKDGCNKCTHYLAVVQTISVERNILCTADAIVTPKLDNIVVGVFNNEYVAIPVTDILELCTFVDLNRKDKRVFMCLRPNKKEID